MHCDVSGGVWQQGVGCGVVGCQVGRSVCEVWWLPCASQALGVLLRSRCSGHMDWRGMELESIAVRCGVAPSVWSLDRAGNGSWCWSWTVLLYAEQ